MKLISTLFLALLSYASLLGANVTASSDGNLQSPLRFFVANIKPSTGIAIVTNVDGSITISGLAGGVYLGPFTNTVIWSVGAIETALVVTNQYVTSNTVYDLLSVYNANRQGFRIAASNGVTAFRAMQNTVGNTQAVVTFDNVGNSGQTYTYWRYGGVDKFSMRCGSSGGAALGPIALTDNIYLNYDGGSGRIYFGRPGVGNILTLESNAVLHGSAASSYYSALSNFFWIQVRSNMFTSMTNHAGTVVITNQAIFVTNTISTPPALALGSFSFWNSNGLMLWKCWNTNGTTVCVPTP